MKSPARSRAFRCMRCGNCCRVPGYVRLRPGEAETIAGFLDLPVAGFTERHTRLTGDRRSLSLTEKDDGSCVFLDPGGSCAIQDVKPEQCRRFPVEWTFPGYEAICRGSSR